MLKKMTQMTPNLIVKDVNSTVDWYQNVLGCFLKIFQLTLETTRTHNIFNVLSPIFY